MKVIFLDIDGVLNFWSSEARTPSGVLGIVDKKVKLLRKIVDATKAKIVLTSSWRKFINNDIDDDEQNDKDGNYMMSKLHRNGVHLLDKLGPEYHIGTRENGINKWLEDHEYVTEYVIIDDEIRPYSKFSHFVNTDGTTGLTDVDVNNAIEILKGMDE